MRLVDAETAWGLWLLMLPLLAGAPVMWSLLLALGMAVVGVGIRFYRLLSASKRKPVLHSIVYSHFVERVRWAMDRLHFEREERPDVGILGLLLKGRSVPVLEVPATHSVHGTSDAILRYLWAEAQGDQAKEAAAAFLQPSAEAAQVEAELCEVLGNQSRRWLYYHGLKDRQFTLWAWGVHEEKIPIWQRWLLPLLAPTLSAAVSALLKVNEVSAARALVKVKELFDKLDLQLRDGRRFLLGDKLTMADITLASLGALVIMPPNFTGGYASRPLPPLEMVPDAVREEVEAFRARPTGRHILRLYQEERLPSA